MSASDAFVHLPEAAFWFGLFVLDRGLAEVLPAKVARGWVHVGVGTIGVLYGLGLFSGWHIDLHISAATFIIWFAAIILMILIGIESSQGHTPRAWIKAAATQVLTGFLVLGVIWALVIL